MIAPRPCERNGKRKRIEQEKRGCSPATDRALQLRMIPRSVGLKLPMGVPCMSQNDAVVLQANFDAWKEGRGAGLTECSPWLYYCLEQYVKPYQLDDDELLSGITDGGNDGGADGIFILANQRPLVTDTTSLPAGSVSKIRVLFLQVKETGGFQPTEIEKFLELTDDFLT